MNYMPSVLSHKECLQERNCSPYICKLGSHLLRMESSFYSDDNFGNYSDDNFGNYNNEGEEDFSSQLKYYRQSQESSGSSFSKESGKKQRTKGSPPGKFKVSLS